MRRDRERELWPGVWPLWRLSGEMQKRGLWVGGRPIGHGESLESATRGLVLECGSISNY